MNLEKARAAWQAMAPPEREIFLRRLGAAVKRRLYTSWDGKSVSELAAIAAFDALPHDLQASLLAATTTEGRFSIEERERVLAAEIKARQRKRRS